MPHTTVSHTSGALVWEETEGGIRIVKLMEDSPVFTIPCEINGLPVVELGDGSFCGKEQLEELILPDTLKKIGRMAFSTCRHLKKLNIPDSVEEFSSHMFTDTIITSLKLPKNLKEIPTSAFAFSKALQTVELNEGLLSIGPHAFYRTRVGEREPLLVPDSVEKIAPGAFCTPFGSISVKTALPVDAFWFSDLPAPVFPAADEPASMITPVTAAAVSQLLQDAVSQLAQNAVQIRLAYGMGFMTSRDIRRSSGEVHEKVIRKLEDSLVALCREHSLVWNDTEFRYLNEILLISSGLGYHVDEENSISIRLLEDMGGDPNLAERMYQLVLKH